MNEQFEAHQQEIREQNQLVREQSQRIEALEEAIRQDHPS